MDAKEPLYVVCRNGFFTLPDSVYASLSAQVSRPFVYVRNDADSFTIASSRIEGGWRKELKPTYRVPMFRDATRLAIVDLKESLRIMPVEWKYGPASSE